MRVAIFGNMNTSMQSFAVAFFNIWLPVVIDDNILENKRCLLRIHIILLLNIMILKNVPAGLV